MATKTQLLGIVLLTAGVFTIICVISLWFFAPLAAKPLNDTATPLTNQMASPAAPALSPYHPPNSAVPLENNDAEPSTDRFIPATWQQEDDNGRSRLLDVGRNPDIEIKALGSYDRSQSAPVFRLAIPSLDIDAAVETVSLVEKLDAGGRTFKQWQVPNKYAVGWHDSSAPPGKPGNTVINGHNNIHGAIFRNLVDLTLGEKIVIYNENQEHIYQVVHREFLPERGESLRTRLRNARWIAPSEDARLTIVTCWPNSTNSHRLVVIAQPLPS